MMVAVAIVGVGLAVIAEVGRRKSLYLRRAEYHRSRYWSYREETPYTYNFHHGISDRALGEWMRSWKPEEIRAWRSAEHFKPLIHKYVSASERPGKRQFCW
jgi:hypothetical protein